jgi:hypothetical protein
VKKGQVMDIEFRGTKSESATLWTHLDKLGYVLDDWRGRSDCDCATFTQQGVHFHAVVAVTAPAPAAPAPGPGSLVEDIADRVARATGVRVDVHHAGQHATGEPPVEAWRENPVWRALAQGPDGAYVMVETTDGRRVTLAQVEFDTLTATGVDPASLTRDGLLVALTLMWRSLGDTEPPPSPPAWFTTTVKVAPRDVHPTDPDVTVVLADRARATLTASQWATLHIAGVNPPSLTAAELADALGVSGPDVVGGR